MPGLQAAAGRVGRNGLVPAPWRRLRPPLFAVPGFAVGSAEQNAPRWRSVWSASGRDRIPPSASGRFGVSLLGWFMNESLDCVHGRATGLDCFLPLLLPTHFGARIRRLAAGLSARGCARLSLARGVPEPSDPARLAGRWIFDLFVSIRASITTNRFLAVFLSGGGPTFCAGDTRAHPCNSARSRPRSWRGGLLGASGAGASAKGSSYFPNTPRGRFGTSRAATFRVTGKISARLPRDRAPAQPTLA